MEVLNRVMLFWLLNLYEGRSEVEPLPNNEEIAWLLANGFLVRSSSGNLELSAIARTHASRGQITVGNNWDEHWTKKQAQGKFNV